MYSLVIYTLSMLLYQPVVMLLLVVMQTINLSILLGSYEKSFTPLTIFLIWIGGLLIIFLYLVSLVNIFTISNNLLIILFFALFTFSTISNNPNSKFINFITNQVEMNQLFLMLLVLMMIYNINVMINNTKSPINSEL